MRPFSTTSNGFGRVFRGDSQRGLVTLRANRLTVSVLANLRGLHPKSWNPMNLNRRSIMIVIRVNVAACLFGIAAIIKALI